ncbi:Manganese transport system membrane protein MntB [Rubripirellula tenax]|uniref:Manganese transport system membrane protein MntB n=1 Tax=Rubripirellula tenax TaxID=2528015 RepID=A0A5C6FHY6_9BACT|nr:iron chelate uptake ABC transporter family permease subunit [Rubripirellula tenax]TWU60415.1 Manganese transport system membrane protein MntB [Rubripirellula tenax]
MSLFDTVFAYNTLVVLAGTMLLGVAAGITGTFLLLRGRALAGDVIGHAALPGVAIAFLVYSMVAPGAGKSLPVMLLGGAISSGLGMLSVLWLRRVARLPEDAVLAIVLSTFFGAGVVIMPIVQASPTGSQAGLPGFIFGQAASIRQADVMLLGSIAIVTIVTAMMLLKEWTLMCFDEGLATVLGYPVRLLDLLLMSLVVAVCVAGMQSVGLLLIVALLIIPASAARYWSDSIRPNIWISAAIGAISAGLGSLASAIVPKLSTGAIIVVVAAAMLAFSVVVGRRHGWLVTRWSGRQDLPSI